MPTVRVDSALNNSTANVILPLPPGEVGWPYQLPENKGKPAPWQTVRTFSTLAQLRTAYQAGELAGDLFMDVNQFNFDRLVAAGFITPAGVPIPH
jgi:hypothetical protein